MYDQYADSPRERHRRSLASIHVRREALTIRVEVRDLHR